MTLEPLLYIGQTVSWNASSELSVDLECSFICDTRSCLLCALDGEIGWMEVADGQRERKRQGARERETDIQGYFAQKKKPSPLGPLGP